MGHLRVDGRKSNRWAKCSPHPMNLNGNCRANHVMDFSRMAIAGLFTGASGSAAAYGVDGGTAYAAHSMFYYAVTTVCLMGMSALYIIFRRGASGTERLIWLSMLVAVHSGSLGVMYLAFSSLNNYALLTPVPYVLALIPGYILANCYKVVIDAAGRLRPQ